MSSIIKHNQIVQEGTVDIGLREEDRESLANEYTSLEKNINGLDTVEVYKEDLSNAIPALGELLEEQLRLEEEKKQYEEALLEKEKQIEEEANKIIAVANEKALAIIKEAEDRAQQLVESVKSEKERILADSMEESREIVERAKEEKEILLNEVEPAVVEIIKKIVGRIVDVKVMGKGEWLPFIVHKMIREENLAEPITIYLSELLYTQHEDYLKEKLASYTHAYTIEIDYTLEEESCMVETSSGNLYYNIKTSMNEIFDELDVLEQLND